EAHDGREQVWKSYEAELTDLMGPLAYAVLVKFCEKRNKAAKPNAVHPATKKAQSIQRKLLPLVF
ncbi:MAG: hypothetical protein QOF57_2831, partial [Frankiaceae bacterium]|nr:hypothetical protein [Frankiaceae bacterium]